MYSIFGTKSKRLQYLEEGEPPPKRIVTEGDTLIKKLAENQLKTNITLEMQLIQQKEFTSSETFTDITGYVRGKTDLCEFQSNITKVNELNKLKSKGLNNNDVNVYKDYLNLGPEFWNKYKDINRDVLQERLHGILQAVNSVDDSNEIEPTPSTSRHQADYLKSLKPQSVETKLLKFATQNKHHNVQLSSPMDEIPDIEKQIMHDIEEFSKTDIKKIRKKARSLGNKIQELTDTVINPAERIEKINRGRKNTLWDVKEKPAHLEKVVEIVDKDKVYTCKPQNLFTIRDGKIIKLNEDKTIPKHTNIEEKDDIKTKLTVEEIKKIPKFFNYDAGTPSKTLFLKNLTIKTSEDHLKNILGNISHESYIVKIMSGKMKGQAFIEFQDESLATEALEALNGVLLDGRPVITQFGKKKNS